MMEQPAVSVQGLTKCYPLDTNKPRACLTHLAKSLFGRKKVHPGKVPMEGHFTALHDLTFEVPKGATLGIIGLNGSGKSTLLQILAGTLLPTSGTVHTNGKVAAILELGSGFNPDFTGRENIVLNSTIQGIRPEGDEDIEAKIIRYADIGEFIDQPVRTYSSGMLVRLAFSVSIHTLPEILIIDEALAVGDARFQAKCFQSLLNLQKQGKTILFVSHDINSVIHICDRTILLHQGKIRSEGDPGGVANDYSKILTGNDFPPYTFHPLKTVESLEAEPVMKSTEEIILQDEREADATGEAEYTYGGERGIIKDFVVMDEEGQDVVHLESGKSYIMEFTVQAKSFLANPIFALKFRNHKRQEIYGTNTLFANVPTPDMQPGEQIRVKYTIQANLIPGSYFVSLGFTRFENGELQVIQRRYDIKEIHVQSADGAFGIANCYARIELHSLVNA
jgi:ABC-type polysaccharide/polyol phosphate transport system ATPase subunit